MDCDNITRHDVLGDKSRPSLDKTKPIINTSLAEPIRKRGYDIIGQIGRGAFSAVYAIKSVRKSLATSDQSIAVKVIPMATKSLGSRSLQIKQELQAVQSLHHSNIVRYFCSFK